MDQLVQAHRSFVGAHVDQDTRAALLELARDEDRSLASVIRRALERELRERLEQAEQEEPHAVSRP